jgi:cell division protein FtsN
MADRYQDRPFPADDGYDRSGDPHASARGETDPLAELARLIGQTDPFGNMGRANQRANPQAPPRTSAREQYQPAPPPPELEPEDDGLPPGPPPWLQRANRQEAPQQDYPSAVHPLQRHAAPPAEPEYEEPAAPYADADHESDPARYDDALYGRLETQEAQPDPAYADDPYGYQDGYGDVDEEQVPKRRGGMVTIVVVLALAVVGTGAAFAYRTFVGSPRSGEPPIIRADAGPTKIVPAPSDGSAKLPDRMVTGDGAEKIVPREEAPLDVNTRSGPRVVFPPLNQNGNPPSAASVAPAGLPPQGGGNGTLPNNEPRKIRTLTVHGDQADGSTAPVGSAPPASGKQAPAARTAGTPPAAATTTRGSPSAANASANAPLSLVPQQGNQPAPAPAAAAEPRSRVAATAPTQTAPSAGPSAGGGYMVQVSSQRNEADAQTSFRALQGKFPAVLGSRSPQIKRADLGDKGVYYRAMVGPFDTSDEASQFCGSLKSAGGQCVVQRN